MSRSGLKSFATLCFNRKSIQQNILFINYMAGEVSEFHNLIMIQIRKDTPLRFSIVIIIPIVAYEYSS
jgi:hypothetical protein